MPTRTRTDFHIGIEQGLLLNSNRFGKLEAPAMDFFINTVTQDFINEVVNEEKEKERFQFKVYSNKDITAKYNKIRNLIEVINLSTAVDLSDSTISVATLPANLDHFISSASTITAATCNVQRKLPNLLPPTVDVYNINEHPYAGSKRYPVTYIKQNDKLCVVHNGRFTVDVVHIIYIKKFTPMSPASPSCDLPSAYHDEIINRTVKFLSANVNNPAYSKILNEVQ